MKLLTTLLILLPATFAHPGTVTMSEQTVRKIVFTTDENKQVIKLRLKKTLTIASCNEYELRALFTKTERDPYITVVYFAVSVTENYCPTEPKTVTIYSDVYEMTLSQWIGHGNILLIPNGVELEIVP